MEIFAPSALDALMEWTRAGSAGEARRLVRASLVTLLRLGAGAKVVELGPRPTERLVLYEREGCPFSRRVREAFAMLDLDALSKPVPRGATRFARELEDATGARTVPVLVDPGVGIVVSGADAILEHLFSRYGQGEVPLRLRLAKTSEIASRIEGEHGVEASPSRAPSRPLELDGYEGSPSTRIVRERLSELELPFVAYQLAPHSPKRSAYFAREHTMELPHLRDLDHDVSIFGVSAILAWLDRTYAIAPRTEQPR